MTLTDNFLIEVAKSLNSESYEVPGYLAVGTTEVVSIETADTTLSGEIGDREALTNARSDKTITFTAIRSGADVIDTTLGDSLESSGFLTEATDGIFLWGIPHSGITQTTSFDLEWEIQFEVRRV